MQVFITDIKKGAIIQTAEDLDDRRLHKQIVEVGQIIKAIRGESSSWSNHPITIQYKNHLDFLYLYQKVLEKYWYYYKHYREEFPSGNFSRLIDDLLKAKSEKDLDNYGRSVDISPIEAIWINKAKNLWLDNEDAKKLLPSFINQEYIDNFKARLFVKNSIYYANFKLFFDKGLGRNNMYFVEGEGWKLYPQNDWKKLIKD